MLSLSSEELSSLLGKISGQNNDTLGNIIKPFVGPKKERHRSSEEVQRRRSNERFKTCCIIATLLNDKVLTKPQRLVSQTILYEYSIQTKQGISYKKTAENKGRNIGLPFYPILIDMLEKIYTHNGSAERLFLFKLLSDPSTSYYQEILKKTPAQLLLDLATECSLFKILVFKDNSHWSIASLRQMYKDDLPCYTQYSTGMGVLPVVPVPHLLATMNGHNEIDTNSSTTNSNANSTVNSNTNNNSNNNNSSSSAGRNNDIDFFNIDYHAMDESTMFEADNCSDLKWRVEDFSEESRVLSLLGKHEYNEAIMPCFLQWAPPVLETQEDELQWIANDEGWSASLLWDSSFVKKGAQRGQLKELLMTAFTTPLNPKQQQRLIGRIKMESNLVLTSEVTSVQLPNLVENNSAVAVELVLQLINSKSDQMMDYLSALVNMDMSFHSIEVVNGLSAVTELPTEFIHLYVSNCISSCENIKDRFMQSRFVRLVCVLLQSLMRKNVVNIKDLFVELQAFCLTFSKVKEAILLFRLIKTLEGRA